MNTQDNLFTHTAITMSVGRDYRTTTKYEFVIFQGEMVIHREGYFSSSTAAKRAGIKAATKFAA